jgi:hypothetical protein
MSDDEIATDGIDRKCENISCNRDAEIKVVFGEGDPFYRVFCEPHARHERGKHDDARYVEPGGDQS